MKRVLYAITVLATISIHAQSLPVDFETATSWVNFDGGTVTTVSNPYNNADNGSANVGRMVKNGGQVWGGSYLTLSSNLDFITNNTFSMKAYSVKSGTKILFKVENSANQSIFYEKEEVMTTTNQWETMTFDFSAVPNNNTYNRIVIIFDLGTVGDGSADFTYYMDDISLDYVAPPSCTAGSTGNTPGSNYTLVWADEFSDDGAPCHENWNYNIGGGGWGNNELQFYTNDEDNVKVENGMLTIKAIKENFGGSQYTSARIKTENLFDFKYGKVEVRAKLPATQGTWPAIWLLGSSVNTIGWPDCGEIDIMEQTGSDKSKVLATCHWSDNGNHASYGLDTTVANTSTQFHTYSLEWDALSVRMSVDGNEYYVLTNSSNLPFNDDFFIILNVAIGGTLGGSVDPTFTEDTMEVDYVRVYQKEEVPNAPLSAAPDPTHDQSDVISLFSGVYTDITVDTWNTVWSNASFEDVMIAGNPTKKYTSLGFNGIETIAGGSVDATTAGMDYFHLDYWTPNITTFRVKLVDFLGDGYDNGSNNTEAELSFTPTQGQWMSLDIPLTDFTNAGMTAQTDITQYIISCDPFGSGTVYVDNVYFWRDAALSTQDIENISVDIYPNPTSTNWNLRGDETITSVFIYDISGKKVAEYQGDTYEISIDGTAWNRGLYFAKIQTGQGIKTFKLIKK